MLASQCDATHGTSGPRWLNELPARLLFSNWTGATVRCLAEGEPRPDVWWVSAADGLNASALPVASRAQLLTVHDGTLTFLPFREHQFREQLHRGSFRCRARNTRGTVLSTVVHVSAGEQHCSQYVPSLLSFILQRKQFQDHNKSVFWWRISPLPPPVSLTAIAPNEHKTYI